MHRVSTCIPPTVCLLAGLDVVWEELPIFPETAGPVVIGDGVSCSGSGNARFLPLSGTVAVASAGWENPGMSSSFRSSSSSTTENNQRIPTISIRCQFTRLNELRTRC